MARKKRILMLEEMLNKIAFFKELKTQDLRVSLINDLSKLFAIARDMAQFSEGEERRAWMKICSYIAQIINSLTNSYDEVRFNEQMKELDEMIDEAKRKLGKKQQTPVV